MFSKIVSRIPQGGLPRYAAITAWALAGTLTLFFMQWALEGSWLLQDRHRVVRMSAQYLPVPFIFMLWLRAVERDGRPARSRCGPRIR